MTSSPHAQLHEETPEHALLVEQVRARLHDLQLGRVQRLSEMTDLDDPQPRLTLDDMRAAIRQAALVLSRFYVHLAGKRALYSSDPLLALRILDTEITDRREHDALQDREFHDRMSAIFAGLHDRHTYYHLPPPYRRTVAFLPFLVEAVGADPDMRWVVTKIVGTAFDATEFRVARSPEDAIVVTHWNGVPMHIAVARSGERSAGANRAARLARGLDRLTLAWLGPTTGPDEDSVAVTYRVGGRTFTRRFDWLAVRQDRDRRAPYARHGTNSMAFAGDPEGEWLRDVKKRLYFEARTPEQDDAVRVVRVGDTTAYSEYAGPDGRQYGYLRIYTFVIDESHRDEFVDRIACLVRRAPAAGLVIDIRGNPGGDAVAAEDLLELFSLRSVEREGLQFLNTPEAGKLAVRHYAGQPAVLRLERALDEATATGAPFVASPPFFVPAQVFARVPQDVYRGPVVVIIDANCYSSTEIFAAGMQDHDLATILGTHKQTGGGGGNVWSHEDLCELCGDDRQIPLEVLSSGTSFALAIRRTTRVGARSGVALEDMGVVADEVVAPTLVDVLQGNKDLLAAAAAAAANRGADAPDPPTVHAELRQSGVFTLHASGVDRVDVFVNDLPIASVSDPDGKRVRLPDHVLPATTARFVGYETGHVEQVAEFAWAHRPHAPPEA
jgi:hypothetical protein